MYESEPGPKRPHLSVIEGGGEIRGESETFLEYARRLVREALSTTVEEPQDNHLSVAPSLPEPEPDPVPEKPQLSIRTHPGNVRFIEHAPSLRHTSPVERGTSGLSPIPTDSEHVASVSSLQHHMEREAREDVEHAHRMGPEPLNPEDFLQ